MSAKAFLAGLAATGLAAIGLAGCETAMPSAQAVPSQAVPPVQSAANHDWAAGEWLAACPDHDQWDEPGPPFRIHANTYYVGTCGISAILITGEDGHVLIDGGTEAGGPLIAANVERLGFALSDVKILLLSHEHFDHAGGLAYLQEQSGARLLVSPAAARAIATGTPAPEDPQASRLDPFPPAPIAGTIGDGETVRLGSLAITGLATPGHSPGAMSWTWRSCAGQSRGPGSGFGSGSGDDCRQIAYLDSLSAVSSDDYKFSAHPELVASFRASLDKVARVPCDIVLTPHPTASAMPTRIAGAAGLIDQTGCARYAQTMQERLNARLAQKDARS